MKIKFLVALLFLSFASPAQTVFKYKKSGQLKFIELTYGVIHYVDRLRMYDPNAPTDGYRFPEDFRIPKQSDSIPTDKTLMFGIAYKIEAKDTLHVPVKIEWVFPVAKTEEGGEIHKTEHYTKNWLTNIPTAFTFLLDLASERAPGKWILNIYIEGNKVHSKTFILYSK